MYLLQKIFDISLSRNLFNNQNQNSIMAY